MNKKNIIIIVLLLLLTIFLTNNTLSNFTNFNKEEIKIDKVFVINIKTSLDRYNLIKKQLDKQNIDFERVDGIIVDDKYKKKLLKDNIIENKTLRNGEIGCALAHLKIWEKNKDNDANILVLEDDIILNSNLKDSFASIQKQIPKDYDIVYLGASNIYGKKISKNVVVPVLKDKIDTTNTGTYAMLINKNSIGKLPRLCIPLTHGIDQKLKKNFDKLNVYYIYKPLVNHNNNISSDRRINNKQKPLTAWFKYTQNKVKVI